MTFLTCYFIIIAIIVLAIIYNIVILHKLRKKYIDVVNVELNNIRRNIVNISDGVNTIRNYNADVNAAISNNTNVITHNNDLIHKHIKCVDEVIAEYKQNKAKNSFIVYKAKKILAKNKQANKKLKTAKNKNK